jgi:hypothetical protein
VEAEDLVLVLEVGVVLLVLVVNLVVLVALLLQPDQIAQLDIQD